MNNQLRVTGYGIRVVSVMLRNEASLTLLPIINRFPAPIINVITTRPDLRGFENLEGL